MQLEALSVVIGHSLPRQGLIATGAMSECHARLPGNQFRASEGGKAGTSEGSSPKS